MIIFIILVDFVVKRTTNKKVAKKKLRQTLYRRIEYFERNKCRSLKKFHCLVKNLAEKAQQKQYTFLIF